MNENIIQLNDDLFFHLLDKFWTERQFWISQFVRNRLNNFLCISVITLIAVCSIFINCTSAINLNIKQQIKQIFTNNKLSMKT